MTLAVWVSHTTSPGNVANDARLHNPDGSLSTADTTHGQAGWELGMRFGSAQDLVGQLERGVPIPDFAWDLERYWGGCTVTGESPWWSLPSVPVQWIRESIWTPPAYVQRCTGPARTVARGEIRRLGINMHGYPGGLQVDGDALQPDGAPHPGINAARFAGYQPLLERLFAFTTSTATILFMGCVAGQGAAGTALLRLFSAAWPSRTFVAFTTIGVISGGVMRRHGEFGYTEAGMRDSNETYPHLGQHDYTSTPSRGNPHVSEWDTYPWASETSTHAKVIRGGSFLRWGGEPPEQTPPTPRP